MPAILRNVSSTKLTWIVWNLGIMLLSKLVEIKSSNIEGANLGAFSKRDIKEGTRLGAYEGVELNYDDYMKLEDQTYVFEVGKKQNGRYIIFYIDASDAQNGNELRYVNGAKTPEQQAMINLRAYQYKEKIYYKATRDIKAGEELIIDYGDNYWHDDEEE